MTGCLRKVHPRHGIGVVIVLAALASLVLAGVAILRMKDRSVLLIAIAATILLALSFAIGEVVAPH